MNNAIAIIQVHTFSAEKYVRTLFQQETLFWYTFDVGLLFRFVASQCHLK